MNAATRRALRDLEDGHITLYATIRRFDEHTGARLDPPELLHVGWDRLPGGLDADWWKPLYEQGLIAPTKDTGTVEVFRLTDAGRQALAAT